MADYVPILFPTWSYGADGNAILVITPTQAATLPPTYLATPIVPLPLTIAPRVPVPDPVVAPLVLLKRQGTKQKDKEN